MITLVDIQSLLLSVLALYLGYRVDGWLGVVYTFVIGIWVMNGVANTLKTKYRK